MRPLIDKIPFVKTVPTHFLWGLALTGLFVLPYVLLGLAGTFYLYERGWFLLWVVSTVLFTLALVGWGWGFTKQLNLRRVKPPGTHVDPSTHWPPAGVTAWKEVEVIAERVREAPPDFNNAQQIWELVQEILQTVAKQYHPKSNRPELEMPLPHLFQVLEWVARDLRLVASQNIPGAHLLTLNDLLHAHRLWNFYQQSYFWYRMISFGLNPVAGILRELQIALTSKMANSSGDQLKQWLTDYAVKKIGFYAIELYSGYIVLDDRPLVTSTLPETQAIETTADRIETQQREDPLRILVIGQVKAGKSSLINAIFKEPRAAVDVIPMTSAITPYKIGEHGNLPDAILFDTAGYEDATRQRDFLEIASDEVLKCDLVLLVCTALSAARASDRGLLDDLRAFFREHPERSFPPVLAVLTHIDQLRPLREWTPPYDIIRPSTPKAKSIHDCMHAVAADLDLEVFQVIPVCLASERVYNVEEGLIPAILSQLPDAQKLRFQRCLRSYKDAETWSRLWQQTVAAGRVAVQYGTQALRDAVRGTDRTTQQVVDVVGKMFERPKPKS